MVVTYSSETGFEQAMYDVFTGKRFCDICRLITSYETSTVDQDTAANTSQRDSLRFD